jgi:hypothetical protein
MRPMTIVEQIAAKRARIADLESEAAAVREELAAALECLSGRRDSHGLSDAIRALAQERGERGFRAREAAAVVAGKRSRQAVDIALLRLMKRGELQRFARGHYRAAVVAA